MPRFFAPLVERRTYVETADLLFDLVVGVAWFTVFTTLVATGASLVFLLVGLPILTCTLYLARAAAALERRRARIFLATEIQTPVRAPRRGEGLFQKLVAPFRDLTTWKELLYLSLVQPAQSVVNFSVAAVVWFLPLWALALPIYATHAPPELWTGRRLDTWHEIIPIAIGGLFLLLFAPCVIRAFAAADRAAAQWGLSPGTTAVEAERMNTPPETGTRSYSSTSRESSAGASADSTMRRRLSDDALVASQVSANEGGASMSDAQQHSNLAARMGRWSAGHWKTATFGWLAFVLVVFALGAMVGTKQVDQNAPGPGESGRMQKILDDGFKQPVGESVLIQSRAARVVDRGFT